MTRRTFLAQTATAAALAPLAIAQQKATDQRNTALIEIEVGIPLRPRFPIHTFTKPFQKLSFDDTADVIAEVGYDGIELPLRKGGQILPERVEEDLPKMVEALKKRGKVVGHITTDIYGTDTPHAEKVLRTAKALGITRYRTGTKKYDLSKPIQPQLDALKPVLKDLAAMNKEIGVMGGIQNHSGSDYIGSPVWDIYELIRGLDPAHLGIHFDIAHATVEGGNSWQVQARLLQPWFGSVYVKDAAWERGPKGFVTKWGPLGNGVVRGEAFFKWLKSTSYAAPICQHCEYLTGATAEDRAQMKKDLAVLKGWMG
jgi:sugar phosphate isomerase/epimerase